MRWRASFRGTLTPGARASSRDEWGPARDMTPYNRSNAPKVERCESEVCPVRGERGVRAARRGTLLPRLLGKEDCRRGDRRARIRAEAVHPRPQRREVPDLSLDHQA